MQATAPVSASFLQVDQFQLRSVVRELLALGQLQVGSRFTRGKSVRKGHRAPAEAAGTVTAVHAQTMKMKFRAGAVAAMQLSRPAQYGAGSEPSEADERRILLRMNDEGSRPGEMAFSLTHEQVVGQYRNDHARRREQLRARRSCRAS